MPERSRNLLWLILPIIAPVVIVVGLWPTDQATADPEARAYNLAVRLKCPICAGESLAGSQTDLAKNLRARIDEEIAAGTTDDEIVAMFVANYGEQVLLDPPRSGLGHGAVGGAAWHRRCRRVRRVRPEAQRTATPRRFIVNTARIADQIEQVDRDLAEVDSRSSTANSTRRPPSAFVGLPEGTIGARGTTGRRHRSGASRRRPQPTRRPVDRRAVPSPAR